jgi:hypothetical protein
MARESLAAVQRHALERALVDGDDARRYFALAGTLEAARTGSDVSDAPHAGEPVGSRPGIDPQDVLPVALLALSVVPHIDDDPVVSPTMDPWAPGTDATRPAVRRGARLALRWFDVPVERVAARAGLPEAVLTAPEQSG